MNAIANVSRREFVKGLFSTGALVLGASLVPEILRAQTSSPGTKDNVLRPNVFVAIQSDGTVSIVAARSEMGTGITTALPSVLADELDADWNKVKIHQADADKRYGSQDTDGSHSIRSFFDVMRSLRRSCSTHADPGRGHAMEGARILMRDRAWHGDTSRIWTEGGLW